MFAFIVSGYGGSYKGEGWIDQNFHVETFKNYDDACARLTEDYEEWLSEINDDVPEKYKNESYYEIETGTSHLWAKVVELD